MPGGSCNFASAWRGIERNGVWRSRVGPGPFAEITPGQLTEDAERLALAVTLGT
jgi:hypothetical protein